MLNRLRDQMSVDADLIKAELKQSIDSICRIFCKRSICNQIKDIVHILADNPSKTSYQKRVLRQLRAGYKTCQSWPYHVLSDLGIENNAWPG